METRYIYDASGTCWPRRMQTMSLPGTMCMVPGCWPPLRPRMMFGYHYDGVGSTVAITDASEAVVNFIRYSPFGMILAEK